MSKRHDVLSQGSVSYAQIGEKLTPIICNLAPGETVLLRSQRDRCLASIGQIATYELNAPYREGRTNETSGIVFADMQLSTDEGAISQQPVAIKPLGREWKVSEEIEKANKINRLGTRESDTYPKPVTFVPIGAHRLLDGKICSLTQFEQGVVSFDNTFWNLEHTPSDNEIRHALCNAAATLIFLHANGFVHGDFQSKNTASDQSGSRVIDITSMRKRTRHHPTYLKAYQDDIETYLRSVNLHHRVVDAGQAHEHFLDYYVDCVEEIFPEQTRFAMKQYVKNLHARDYLDNSR